MSLGFVRPIKFWKMLGIAFCLVGSCAALGCSSDGDGDGDVDYVEDADASDFEGCWSGEITYQPVGADESETATIGMEITAAGETLGILITDDEGEMPLAEGSVSGGALIFEWPSSDPDDPDCASWDFTATSKLTVGGELSIEAAGKVCSDMDVEGSGMLEKVSCD